MTQEDPSFVVGPKGLVPDAWNNVFPIELSLTTEDWPSIQPVPDYATYLRTLAPIDKKKVEKVITKSDPVAVATYDNLVAQINLVINSGVHEREQADTLKRLVNKIRTLIHD